MLSILQGSPRGRIHKGVKINIDGAYGIRKTISPTCQNLKTIEEKHINARAYEKYMEEEIWTHLSRQIVMNFLFVPSPGKEIHQWIPITRVSKL